MKLRPHADMNHPHITAWYGTTEGAPQLVNSQGAMRGAGVYHCHHWSHDIGHGFAAVNRRSRLFQLPVALCLPLRLGSRWIGVAVQVKQVIRVVRDEKHKRSETGLQRVDGQR